jgi:hypothetical protein
MNFAGEFALISSENQRHAAQFQDFFPCAEWVRR